MKAEDYKSLTSKPSKYRSRKTEYNGRLYDSKKEAMYSQKLDILKAKGVVTRIEYQVEFPYYIVAEAPNIGSVPAPIKSTRTNPFPRHYRLDFKVTYKDKHIEYIDVKGYKTETYLFKKNVIEQLYNITITEV